MATPSLTESLYEYMAAPGYEPQELTDISNQMPYTASAEAVAAVID